MVADYQCRPRSPKGPLLMTARDGIGGGEVGADTPLRLDDAAAIAYPKGGMTGATLRREAAKGRLAVERVAGKLYTTLADIEEMRRRCRELPKAPGFGSSPSGNEEPTSSAPSGASLTTEDLSAARDAALRNAERLKASLRHTSTRSAIVTARSLRQRTG